MGAFAGRVISPLTPFASWQPGWAHEDIKVAWVNIVLEGLGGVEDGSAPPPPPPHGRA